MKILVTGRTGSGKSTFVSESKYDLFTLDSSIEVIELNCQLSPFTNLYVDFDEIIYVDTPAILCYSRINKKKFDAEKQKKEDLLLSYVTELPSCRIIKNDGDLELFRVRIKRLLEELGCT